MGLDYHLFLPQMRMTHDAIVERARAAESAGFEGIAFMDHLAPPLALEHDMWEAMAIASWTLAHTSALTVGHLVLCDAMRHPAVLARQATSLDHASDGRLELGLGWGSVPEELEVFGVGNTEASARIGRLEESLAILRGLWTGEVVDHDGEHFRLVGARQRPVPTRPIPITIGGVGRRTLALVREHADWWNIPVHQLHRLDEMREHAGDTKVSVQLMVALALSDDEVPAVTEVARRRFGATGLGERLVIGTADTVAARIRALGDRGVERVYLWFADFAPPETLERCADVFALVERS